MRNHCDHCCINTSRKLSDLLWAVKPCGKEQLGELTWCLSLIEKNASHVWLHSRRKAQVWRHCLRSWCGWTSSLPDHLLPQCPFITSFGWVASSCQALHTHTHTHKNTQPPPLQSIWAYCCRADKPKQRALKLYSLPIHHVTFWQSSISCIVVTCLWPQVEPLKRTQLHNTVTLLSLNAHKQKKNPNKTLGIVVKYPLLMAATPSMLSLAKQEALKKGESKAVGECSRVRTLEGSGRRQSSRDESADGGKGAPKHGTAEHPTHCWGSAQALPVIQL